MARYYFKNKRGFIVEVGAIRADQIEIDGTKFRVPNNEASAFNLLDALVVIDELCGSVDAQLDYITKHWERVPDECKLTPRSGGRT